MEKATVINFVCDYLMNDLAWAQFMEKKLEKICMNELHIYIYI